MRVLEFNVRASLMLYGVRLELQLIHLLTLLVEFNMSFIFNITIYSIPPGLRVLLLLRVPVRGDALRGLQRWRRHDEYRSQRKPAAVLGKLYFGRLQDR